MKYFIREYFCENWTYAKRPIENTIFSKFVVGMANLGLKWEDPPNGTVNLSVIWRFFPFLGKIFYTNSKFLKYGVFNGVFHICPVFTKIFSCEYFMYF